MGSDKVIIVSGKTEGGANAKQHQTTPKFNGNKKRGNRSKSSVEPEEYLSWRKPASNQVTPTSVNTSPIVPSSSTINKKRDEKNFPENRRNSTGNNNKNQSTNNGNKRETKNKKKKTKSESSVLRPNEANGTIVSAQFSSTPKKMPIKMIANLPSSKKCDSIYLSELMAELQQLDALLALSNSCSRLLQFSSLGNNNDLGSAGNTPIRGANEKQYTPLLSVTRARDILLNEILLVEERLF